MVLCRCQILVILCTANQKSLRTTVLSKYFKKIVKIIIKIKLLNIVKIPELLSIIFAKNNCEIQSDKRMRKKIKNKKETSNFFVHSSFLIGGRSQNT